MYVKEESNILGNTSFYSNFQKPSKQSGTKCSLITVGALIKMNGNKMIIFFNFTHTWLVIYIYVIVRREAS